MAQPNTIMSEPSRRKRWFLWILVLGIWTALGFFLASQASLVIFFTQYAKEDLPKGPQDSPWLELLRLSLAECYILAILSLVIFRLRRLFPLEQNKWLQGLLFHGAASIVFAFLETTISAFVNEFLRFQLPKPTVTGKVLLFFFMAKLHQNIIIYWIILGVSQTLDYYRKYRERELRASQLETRLAQAQLQVLKMQLHPHFLFNTLNAISALIHQDVELADRMIARLGDLLRTTLDNANKQEVPLHQELDFIQPYLEIEKARLGTRLTVQLDIDPTAMDAEVPNMILQPLVENAIRHGIAPRSEPGRIEISARRDDGFLQLQVRDDGPGLPPTQRELLKEGVGLANTRARLEQLYGPDQRLDLENGAGTGLTVRVSIPFHEALEDKG
jgi:two-component system, LytTR family, sensor kinase